MQYFITIIIIPLGRSENPRHVGTRGPVAHPFIPRQRTLGTALRTSWRRIAAPPLDRQIANCRQASPRAESARPWSLVRSTQTTPASAFHPVCPSHFGRTGVCQRGKLLATRRNLHLEREAPVCLVRRTPTPPLSLSAFGACPRG